MDSKEKFKLLESTIRCFSHEIRTPLNGALGFADLLEEDQEKLTEDQKAYIGYIQKGIQQVFMRLEELLLQIEQFEEDS
jgi:signal transduction histidine kinase